jgi:hypothetical protein
VAAAAEWPSLVQQRRLDMNARYRRPSFVQSDGSPSEAADDAGPGARMQIGMAMQEPAWMPWPQIRPVIQSDIQLDKWDVRLDMFG